MKLKLATAAKYKDKYFLTALNMNALFVYEQESGKLLYLDSFQTDRAVYCMYIKSFLYKDEIWFLPAEEERIAILNTCNMQIEYITIDFHGRYNGFGFRYNNFLRFYGHYVCFVPRSVDEAVIIDMETKKIENYYKLTDQKEQFQNVILLNNTLYFYPWKGKRRVAIHLLSQEMNYAKWENNEEFGDSVYDKESGNIFHAPSRENHMLISNIQGKIIEKKRSNCLPDTAGYHTFYSSVDNKKILFWGAKGVIIIEPKKIDMQYIEIRGNENEGMLIPIDSYPKEAYTFGGNHIFRYNDISQKFIPIEITINFEQLIKQIEKKERHFSDLYDYKEQDFVMENAPLTLDNFINMLDVDLTNNCMGNISEEDRRLIGCRILQHKFID